MWRHVLALSPLLTKYYWPLRLRLGQITTVSPDEQAELVCRSDFHRIRGRWNRALSGSPTGLDPPFDWSSLQRLGVLRRIGTAFDGSVRTTCHSLDDPDAVLTAYPAQRLVIRQSLQNAGPTFRSATVPSPQQRGAFLLWEGTQRALSDWTYDMNRSLEDGVRRHVCGHVLWHVLWGAYYSWLSYGYEQDAAQRLNLLLHWTQLEVGLRQFCEQPDDLTLPLIGDRIEMLVSRVGDVAPLPPDLRPRRDDIAAALHEWLPAHERVRSLQFDELGCPHSHLQSLSALLTDAAALTAVTD